MSDNIIANGVVYGSEVATAAKDVSYTGIDNVTNVEEALDYLRDDLADKADAASLSTVASTGNYNDLQNTPSIPSKVSDLINDNSYVQANTNSLEHYYTKDKLYTKEEVEELVNTTNDIYKVVTTLPTENISKSVIYLVRKSTDEEGDLYQKAVYVNNKWEYFKEGGNAEIYYDQDVETSKVSNNTAPSTKAVYDYIHTLGLDDEILSGIDITKPNAINSEAVATYVTGKIDGLKDVARTGSYNDLTDKPIIPEVVIATTDKVGVVKPDGNSILIDEDGIISSTSSIPATSTTAGIIAIDDRYFEMENTTNIMKLDLNKTIDEDCFEIDENDKITLKQDSGSNVEWNQIETEGNHIADITINGETTEVYAKGGSDNPIPEYELDKEIVIGKWLDGYPIYRRICTLTKSDTNTMNLSSFKIKSFLNCDAIIHYYNTYGTNITRLSAINNADSYLAFNGITNYLYYGLGIYGNQSQQIVVDYLILEYTKTTDAPLEDLSSKMAITSLNSAYPLAAVQFDDSYDISTTWISTDQADTDNTWIKGSNNVYLTCLFTTKGIYNDRYFSALTPSGSSTSMGTFGIGALVNSGTMGLGEIKIKYWTDGLANGEITVEGRDKNYNWTTLFNKNDLSSPHEIKEISLKLDTIKEDLTYITFRMNEHIALRGITPIGRYTSY